VTIKATVEELDLVRRALTAHRSFENEILKDRGKGVEDMKRKNVARQEIVLCTTMLEKLGVKS